MRWTPVVMLAMAFPSIPPALQSKLRYQLENLSNEEELLIRNHKVDRSDVVKQERDFKIFHVFEKIPLSPDRAGLKSCLLKSAQKAKIKMTRLEIADGSKKTKKPPFAIYTDAPPFYLSKDQVAGTFLIQIVVYATDSALRQWVQSWSKEDEDRWIEPKKISSKDGFHWIIRARAYYFHDISFPRLLPRDPEALLPSWARIHPKPFSNAYPLLWKFVERIHSLAPQAKPLYRIREKFLLNDARMSFFLSKTLWRR